MSGYNAGDYHSHFVFPGRGMEILSTKAENNNFRELIKEMPESDESLNMKIIQGYKRITFIHLY